ncbi:MAG TPA: lysophospholipid acyltransferase family protein [Chthoniobacterales bacterium]|nr:lysophospholipid acyltransferase family protein [Chthoniobacterales bacterium]
MSALFHKVANRIAALSMKALFGLVARTQVLRPENTDRSGAFLLASNHISHFDPFIISGVVRRKIDWMAMAEFFPYPVLGQFLRAVDAFPADRDRANRATIRSAIDRLRNGRVVGIFPEGGIRDGKNSILEGANARSGVAALADLASVPVLPCVIIGSDRLYNAKRWLPFRRTPVWIAFGNLIAGDNSLPKAMLRERLEREFTNAVSALYRELRERFSLTADDLPHSPQSRMAE